MNRDQTSQRAQRRRILLVGRADAHCRLSGIADCKVMLAANLFDAIGELSTAPAREPTAMMLLTPDALNGTSDLTLEKIRRIDPGVRIALVQDASGGACPIDPGAFDVRLSAPVDETEILKILQNGNVEQPTVETPTSVPAHTSAPSDQDRKETTAPPRPATSSTVKEASRELLGDVDLVAALLDPAENIRQIALRLIEQQTGWRGVDLVDGESAEGGVPVRHQAQDFGRLHSADAPPQELATWADWLAHWLAMEASHRRYRYLAHHDELTGAWNRRHFMKFLADSIDKATPKRRPITVMVFDIDDFKIYNDSFGHSAGDEILRETVRLLTAVIRKDDLVFRIGGDEFAVIFADLEGPREPGSQHPESIEQIARRFQDEICQMHFPKLGIEAPGTLSISGGLATYPWDGNDPASLLEHADQLALESKRKGKNIITLGPGAQKNCCRPPETHRDTPRDNA